MMDHRSFVGGGAINGRNGLLLLVGLLFSICLFSSAQSLAEDIVEGDRVTLSLHQADIQDLVVGRLL